METFRFNVVDATTNDSREVELKPDLHGFTFTCGGRCVIVDLSGDRLSIYETDKETGDELNEDTVLSVDLGKPCPSCGKGQMCPMTAEEQESAQFDNAVAGCGETHTTVCEACGYQE